jgi:hypothetical protein
MKQGRFIEVRKLAALDIALHGPRLILIEFGFSAFLLVFFGLFFMIVGYGHSLFGSFLAVT